MARYEIIDEPHSKPWAEKIIVDPTIILFAAILVPLLWDPPLYGRFWMPLVWLIGNGYAIGSSTLSKEIAVGILGLFSLVAIIILVNSVYSSGFDAIPKERLLPYLRLIFFGLFFLTLYLVVFRQSTSYQLHKYSSERS